MIEVLLLHFWQIILIESSLHVLQNRLWMFVKNFSMCEAFSKSRVGPPLSPIGNSVWTGGFICLGAAFSGLPILTPTDVEYFGLIFIPEVADIILVTDLETSTLPATKHASVFARVIDGGLSDDYGPESS